jgi:hypothetical protein
MVPRGARGAVGSRAACGHLQGLPCGGEPASPGPHTLSHRPRGNCVNAAPRARLLQVITEFESSTRSRRRFLLFPNGRARRLRQATVGAWTQMPALASNRRPPGASSADHPRALSSDVEQLGSARWLLLRRAIGSWKTRWAGLSAGVVQRIAILTDCLVALRKVPSLCLGRACERDSSTQGSHTCCMLARCH